MEKVNRMEVINNVFDHYLECDIADQERKDVSAVLESLKELDYNEVFKFMKEFGIDILNSYGELIIDEKTNVYTFTTSCNDLDDVKTRVVYSLCRPIGKGLELQGKSRDADRLLMKVNKYFKTELTKDDMLLMYQDLCYERKLEYFKDFIKRGFPMEELRVNNNV